MRENGVAEDGGILVHITGTDIKTEEREPEHFVFYTRVIPPFSTPQEPGGEGAQVAGEWYQQILNNDPKRKSAAIYFPDGPAILCHSEAQASNIANITPATTPFPEGAFFPQGASAAMDGTGPAWVVNPSASAVIRVTVITNRRGDA